MFDYIRPAQPNRSAAQLSPAGRSVLDSVQCSKRTTSTISVLLLCLLTLGSIFSTSRLLQTMDRDFHRPQVDTQAIHPPVDAKHADGSNSQFHVKGFGACLLIMDDNHLLPEWLAYHYQRLPMRRLFVAIDPKSKTSPTPIFDRYRKHKLMNITEWTDTDYFPPNRTTDDYNVRQRHFIAACLKQLAKENYTWTTIHDTDEFIVVNPMADSRHRLQNIPSKPKFTILDILEAPNNTWWKGQNGFTRKYTFSPCQPMRRFDMATMEFNDWEPIAIENDFPTESEYSMSDFVTYRYVYPHSNRKRDGKSLLDLSRVDVSKIREPNANPHLPSRLFCDMEGIKIKGHESPLAMFQYMGTLEQYLGRNHDGRNKRKVADFTKWAGPMYPLTTAAQGWIHSFFEDVGKPIAAELLEGAGRLQEWQKMNSTHSVDTTFFVV